MDAAAAGDTVLVAPGIYSDFETRTLQAGGPFTASAIVFMKQGVSVISEGGSDSTVLDLAGQGDGDLVHCVIVWEQAGSGMVLQGFRITGTPSGFTGATVVHSAPVGFLQCVFESLDGIAGGRPGGMRAVGSEQVSLQDCVFQNCFGSPSEAGGVLADGTSILAEDCVFEACSGGALYSGSGSFGPSAVFRRCRFLDNVGGGGLTTDGPQVTVEDSWFEGNSAIGGAGFTIRNATNLLVARNVIVGNSAAAQAGASISRSYGTVTGNTFHGNIDQIEVDGTNLNVSSPDGVGFIAIENNIFSGARGSRAVRVPQVITSSSCNVFWDNPLGNVNINYP
ncbi:right-handed parallel beta-helix repeat-containing protein, partial [bacterium]|nr:right-handed parallel beta-helix repeat-containing protein [bacterium]